jgi:hypothetical protein
MNSTQKKVASVAPETTEYAYCSFSNARPFNGFTKPILARIRAVRYPVALLSILAGYGFASAENWLPTSACAFVGLALAEGPEQFYRFLHRLRAAEQDALNGHEPDGRYTGDGVPRDASGHAFEPLDWEGLRQI